MLLAIDTWAHKIATRVAMETGWRASEIYRVLVGGVEAGLRAGLTDEVARSSAAGAIDAVVQRRSLGETFQEACARGIVNEVLQQKEATPMDRKDYIVERAIAKVMWGGFYRCPTTGRIIEALEGDDKVVCNCRRSNPRVLAERTEQTGTHIIRFLDEASVDDYLAQREAERTQAPQP